MTIVPISLREARRFVAEHHRHNEPPAHQKFSIGLKDRDALVGVVIAERPKARHADDGLTLEVTRLTTIGSKNACSMLYSAACRAAFAMGYRRVITYTLAEESGSSLLASGFRRDRESTGGEWARESRPMTDLTRLRLFDAPKVPTGPKVRWVREAA